MCVTSFLSHMDSWVVIPRQDCTQLANQQLWRSWTPVRISLGFWQRSTLLERRKRISWQLARMPWFVCIMASPGKHWTYWGFNVSAKGFHKHCQSWASYPTPYISICKAALPTGVCSGSALARSWHGCQWLGMGYPWRENGSRYDRDEACSRLPARCHPLWLQSRLQHPTMQLSHALPRMLFRMQWMQRTSLF